LKHGRRLAGILTVAAPGVAGLGLLAALGCAPALRTAPPLADLAGAPAASRVEAPALQARAAGLCATRDPNSMREAAGLALRAAAADPSLEPAILTAVESLVWLADHEPGAAAREAAAVRAVQAAQWCDHGAPDSPACSFWLGAALGVQARERPTTGIAALPAIEAAFKAAAAGDPSFDSAAPDRALAVFYVRAPQWPAGPGDPDRGLEHARSAIARFPDYPPNLLALAEALAATGDPEGAANAAKTALSRARSAAAAGVPDAAEWVRDAEVASGLRDKG
jgi:hypothetical protein